MLMSSEWLESTLVHKLQPCGPIPTVKDADGIYPYESFCETAKRPSLQKLRMISIENRWMKVTVCPDLGGKVQSIVDKTSGKEVLFQSGSVRPVRILPRMAFISGGIEVSFPIAHTPVQIENVHSSLREIDGRLYVWCGEREIRCGMHWTVEFSLGSEDRYLTQRTIFYNASASSHSWMSWSNAALPGRDDSEFHFPGGKVLRHADVLEEAEWPSGRNPVLADYDRMQGFFWKNPDCHAFGMYTPSLGSGLYHIADPEQMPGIKLWLYGKGRHEPWAHLTAARQESYVEIQAGPLLEQSENSRLAPGETHSHTEFWIPSVEPLDIRALRLPTPELVELAAIPLFDWAERGNIRPWLELERAFSSGSADLLPPPPVSEQGVWPPSGMDGLGEALTWAIVQAREEEHRLLWRYYLGVWHAGRDRIDEAVAVLSGMRFDPSYALLGKLLRVCYNDLEASRAAFASIASSAWSLHPQVFVERDMTLASFGNGAFAERTRWFEQVDSLADDALLERKANLLYEQGAVREAKELLERKPFEKIHQRYERSELWRRIAASLGEGEAAVPEHLGEDDLAVYGAYRVSESEGGK